MANGWFLTGTPTMNQLGATMGAGVNPVYQQQNGMTADMLARYLAQQQAELDRDFGLKRDALDYQHEIAKQNVKNAGEAQALNKWYQQEQVKLARERMAQEANQFNARLGADMLSVRANLTGPDKVFEAYDYDRGAASMQDTPLFLQALRDNTTLRDFGAQGGRPDPVTLDSLAGKLSPGYGATQEARTMENALATIDDISAAGAHKLGAGALEQLRPDEFKAFQSGQGKAGYSTANFLDAYRKSRVGNRYGTAA